MTILRLKILWTTTTKSQTKESLGEQDSAPTSRLSTWTSSSHCEEAASKKIPKNNSWPFNDINTTTQQLNIRAFRIKRKKMKRLFIFCPSSWLRINFRRCVRKHSTYSKNKLRIFCRLRPSRKSCNHWSRGKREREKSSIACITNSRRMSLRPHLKRTLMNFRCPTALISTPWS